MQHKIKKNLKGESKTNGRLKMKIYLFCMIFLRISFC